MRAALAILLFATIGAAEETPADPAAATPPASAPAPPPAPLPPIDGALARRVDDLARQLGETEARLARQTLELQSLRARVDEAASHALFHLGGIGVSLFGFVQADAVAYSQASVDDVDPATGKPLNETRFLIRRARLHADFDWKWLGAALELDGNTINGPVVRLVEGDVSACLPACASGRPPLAMVTVGLMRIPFGFEVQEKDYVRLFLERSTVMRAMFNGEFDLGARLQGGWRWLRWQVAAMNGHPSGEKQFALVDPTASKDLLGRVGADARPLGRLRVRGGFSALWGTGFHAGTPASKDQLVWHDVNGDGQVDATEIGGLPGQAPQPSLTFSRYAVAGDLSVAVLLPRLGELDVYGELVWATNLDRALVVADPVAAGHDLRELGWYVAVKQQLGKHAAIGVRYDAYNPAEDAREQVGANLVARDLSFSTLAIVAAAMYEPYARLTLEYDHNTNGLGRTATGAPATLGSDVVTIRAQATF